MKEFFLIHNRAIASMVKPLTPGHSRCGIAGHNIHIKLQFRIFAHARDGKCMLQFCYAIRQCSN